MEIYRRHLMPFLSALVAVSTAGAVRLFLNPMLEEAYPYFTFLLAAIYTVWRGTLASSFFATVLGFLIAFWWFVFPHLSTAPAVLPHLIEAASYFVIALSIIYVGHDMRRAEHRARQEADDTLTAKEALQESEEKFRVMAEKACAAFGIVQGTRFVYANPAFAAMSGYSREEILQMDFPDMVHPDSREMMLERARLRQAGKEAPEHYEFRMVTKNNEARWIDFSPVGIHYKGKPAIVGTGFDVTERKLAEEALRESTTTLQSYYDNSSLLMGIVEVLPDHSDVIQVFDNPATCRFFGFSENATMGRRATELGVPADLLRWWIVRYKEAEQRREPVSFEYYGLKGNGEEYWLSVTVSYIGPGPSGGNRVAYVAQDITDRKRAENALRLEEERLDVAQRAGKIGTFDWIIPENRTIWSRQVEELYGLPEGGFGGTNADWEKMVHPEDRDRVMAEAKRAMSERRDINVEYRIIWPDGSVHWILDMGHTIFNDAGEPVRMVGVNMDVTERKRAEQALRDADRKKDEFLAMLAHELRNPMAAISAAASLLSLPNISPSKAQFARDALKERIKQLARLIDDLLDVSRITRGKIELHKESLEMEAVIDRSVEATKDFFNERSQKLQIRVLDALPVHGDPVRLEQIITNLLTNASRYSNAGKAISLTALREACEVVVRVRDEGIGISPELLPRIFDPFTQAETSLARTRGGLGLGLTIVKNLCEMHGGKVLAKSAGEGRGSEFEVRLPIGEAPKRIDSKGPESASQIPLRILLVEDNADTAILSATALELEGDTVEIAGDGPEGVRKALGMKPDVILLDIGLPGCDGYEVAERVRQGGLNDTLIVAITGYGQEQDVIKAHEAGIDHHLLKPVEYESLRRLIVSWKDQLG